MSTNRDWIGNKKSTFATLGASNHSDHERADHDYYATDPKAIDLLVSSGVLTHKYIWENACGEGHLSKRLNELGYYVHSTDLIDRGYGDMAYTLDFLDKHKCHKIGEHDIVTNPPYKYAMEWVLTSLDVIDEGRQVCLFLKTTFLEGQKRYKELFSKYPPKYVLQCVNRIKCAINGNFDAIGSSASSYAWFVWEKGYNGDTIVKWLK